MIDRKFTHINVMFIFKNKKIVKIIILINIFLFSLNILKFI